MQEDYCVECGKEIYPLPTWVFKDKNGYYCSWTCWRKRQQTKETDGKKAKAVGCYMDMDHKQLVHVYPSMTQAAVAVIGTVGGVRAACVNQKRYRGYYWGIKDEVSKV